MLQENTNLYFSNIQNAVNKGQFWKYIHTCGLKKNLHFVSERVANGLTNHRSTQQAKQTKVI